MLGLKVRTLFFSPLSSSPKPHLKPYSLSSPSNFCIRMSSSSASSQIIEHVVLFKVKDETEPAKVAGMMSGLNGLTSLDQVLHLSAGPIHRNRSSMFKFTHMLHSRYSSKEDLSVYSGHPSHMSVVKESVLPICEDVMAVDWVADNLSGPVVPRPGSAMRLTFMRLNEGLGDEEKEKVLGAVGEIKDCLGSLDQMTYGENFSPARAKGFSIASIAIFPGLNELEALDSNPEVVQLQKDKVRDLLDRVIVLDYVVPPPQSASL
ncbi:hypothetical protein AAG906_009620 [Vitis piasezkii]|uniref:Stress-response A/B barrel domain-containing protein UP3 n=1 Tax=Vitis vinifera TaxID=29760 RepID=A0A438J990_VITVI|nr:stress-response A/B barrel domain-containing protein UP3-like [Vitis riparia]RVX05537.1 Stress-response A/B barrel domain-containing protein UP3 [Vitis vinifera]